MKRIKTFILTSILMTVTAYTFAEFDNTNILVEQAVNHIYQQRYKQAHSILKEAYEQSPRHPGVHFNLGRLFELTGNYQEALKEYRLAASLDQSMVAARRGMARCTVELKKASVVNPPSGSPSSKANGYAAPVVTQKRPKQTNQYTLPENPYPNQPSYSGYDSPTAPAPAPKQQVKTSAPIVSQNGDALQTSKVYSSTSNLNLPPLPQSVTVKASRPSGENKAKTMLDNGDTDGAIKHLEKILENNPDSPEAHYLMGKALSMKNNLFGSIKHLEEAIRVDEKYYEAYYLLGKNYAKVNLMEDAIKNYLVYYGVKPQASVAVEIARIYENMGNQAQANDFYIKANTMNPGNSNLQMQVNESSVSLANDLYLRGNHAFSINQFREAASLFNQAISTNSLPDGARRDALRKLEIAKFRVNESNQQLAPMQQGFVETRKNFAPTSLKYYQLSDINYKNNFTNAISVEWTGYIARRITRYGRDFLLMIKECDRDELEYMNKIDNDYKLNKHFNNQPVFLIMTSKGGFPNFIKEKTMITFTGRTEWQFYEIINDMGSIVRLPTFEYVSAFPVKTARR
ncbi:MAG: tetratricopeptide repeat protein [Candidatus Riflebacteria bacterium]|nr:tetratricopeptide repeat protein [Candidatus Riflebacteria bacterium]